MEIEQIKEYQVFKNFGKAVYEKNKITNAPEGHQKIRVHFVFDVKHCGKFKARLVADGHLAKEPMETVYSGVVSIRNLRLAMFLAELNDLELRVIQFPPEMDENWVRYGLAKLGQISKLPNWQRVLFCAYTTQLLHSTGEVCWNNKDSYFIWFEFVC